jgi:hypothetical protein
MSDERRIEARRADDGRDADPLGRHDHVLDIAQVEAGVLHVDEGSIEARVADDLDDLRIGDPAGVGAQSQSALLQDLLHAIGLHLEPPTGARAAFSSKLRAPARPGRCGAPR